MGVVEVSYGGLEARARLSLREVAIARRMERDLAYLFAGIAAAGNDCDSTDFEDWIDVSTSYTLEATRGNYSHFILSARGDRN